MAYREYNKQAADGIDLFFRIWDTPTDRKGTVCLVHGLGEHGGRYEYVASRLNRSGFSLMTMDLRGHGRSGGKRGHTPSYQALMDDIHTLSTEARTLYPDTPLFLYGHSMGGNLVLNYCLRMRLTDNHSEITSKGTEINGVIATGPWLKLAFDPPKISIVMAKLMNALYPAFTQSNGLDSNALSHKEDISGDYTQDPLVHSLITARLFTSIHQSGEWALEHVADFKLPLLLMHGSADSITSHDASREFAKRAPDCTFKSWNGLYHEIHNEPERDNVIDFILGWMNDRIS